MGNAGSKPADYSDAARGITIILIVLTTAAVVARTISRVLQKARVGADDVLTFLAYLVNLGQLITGLLEVSSGAFSLERLATATLADLNYIKNVKTALGILYSVAILAVKISVLFLLRRIFTMTDRTFRAGWWINLLYLFPCWTIVVFTIIGVQIAPPGSTGFGTRNSLSRVASPIVGSLNALSDLMVLALPISVVVKLRLPRKDKYAIIGLFSLGMVATSISIMRVVRFHIKREHHWNSAYGFYNDAIMSFTETSTGLICACLVNIKPLLRKTREITLKSASDLSELISSRNRSKTSNTGSGYNEVRSLHSGVPNSGINRSDRYDVVLEVMPAGQTKDHVLIQNVRPWEHYQAE